MTKEYPQGFGCIKGRFGHFECLLTDSNLDYFSLAPKPPKPQLEIELTNLLSSRLLKKADPPIPDEEKMQ